jgi:inosose dehydratase
MRLAGFTGTELGAKYPREAPVLLPLLQRHGLQLASGWCSGRLMQHDVDTEWRAIAPHVALLQAAGVRAMVYGEVSNTVHGQIDAPLSTRVSLTPDQLRAYGERLTRLAERLVQETGIRLAFHHHVGTIIETPADILALLACTGDAVGLTFDTGHATFGGGDPVALLRHCVSRVAHVHLKDIRLPVIQATRAQDRSFLRSVLDGAFTVPGDGTVDFPAVLACLHQAGYSGWAVVEAEQDPAQAHPLTYARMAHDCIAGQLGDAGYTVAAGVWQG